MATTGANIQSQIDVLAGAFVSEHINITNQINENDKSTAANLENIRKFLSKDGVSYVEKDINTTYTDDANAEGSKSLYGVITDEVTKQALQHVDVGFRNHKDFVNDPEDDPIEDKHFKNDATIYMYTYDESGETKAEVPFGIKQANGVTTDPVRLYNAALNDVGGFIVGDKMITANGIFNKMDKNFKTAFKEESIREIGSVDKKGINIVEKNDITLFELEEVEDIYYRLDIEINQNVPGGPLFTVYNIYAIKKDDSIDYSTIKFDSENNDNSNIVMGTHAPINLSEGENIIYRYVFRDAFSKPQKNDTDNIRIEFKLLSNEELEKIKEGFSDSVTKVSKPLTLIDVYYEKYDYMCAGKFINGENMY